ncbi:MAG: fasciclin domain-containing protein [Pseudomonadota bacterium]
MNRRFALKSVAAAGAIALVAGCSTGTDTGDIVDVASSSDQFSTLAAAVAAAGLVEPLRGDGPLTVFAPTNDAFAKLPEGTVENLLKPENKDQLVAVLTYHVAGGNYPAAALAGQQGVIPTLQGGNVTIDGVDGVTVNGANVIAADVQASNGVIHVIDTVLLPQ